MDLDEAPWDESQWDDALYKYEQIAEWVAERIRDGRFPDRTRLSEVQLQTYFGVGRATIRHAFALLRERGLIRTMPGKGSVVISRGDVLG